MPKRKVISKVDQLGVRADVEAMFAAGNKTLQEIREVVKEKTGEDIGNSSLSREHQKWTTEQQSKQDTKALGEAVGEAIKNNPDADLTAAGIAMILRQLNNAVATKQAGFADADLLEVSNLFIRLAKVQADLDAKKQAAQQIDRPAVYLACLNEFAEYLTRTTPAALTALGETFDGFMREVRRTYAPAH